MIRGLAAIVGVVATVLTLGCSAAPAASTATAEKFPTLATTGPTAWAMKQHWVTKGETTITKPGTYTLTHYTGTVTIAADNVRLINDTVTTDSDWGVAIEGKNAYISRVIISGKNNGTGRVGAGIKDRDGSGAIPGTMIDRVEIKWWSTGVQDVMGTIQNSYIHAPGFAPGDHTNGTTQNGSTEKLVIKHNRILNPLGQTDAISLFCDFGREGNVTVTDNWIAGGGYAFYGGGPCPTHNIVVTNNVFSTQFYKHSGYWGPSAYFNDGDPGNVWSGNRYSNGTVIGP